jgi:RNA polymerase sigma-54 factor
MAISQKLGLRQTTALVMTPQLQQAIKLLQLSNQELDTFIETELAENPLLERESVDGGLEQDTDNPEQPNLSDQSSGDGDEDFSAVPDAVDTEENLPVASLDVSPLDGTIMAPSDDSPDAPLESGKENIWSSDDREDLGETPPSQFADWGSGGSFDNNTFSPGDNLTQEDSLRDHLSNQINTMFATPQDRMTAGAFVDYLDETGYLRTELDEIAERLGITDTEANAVLARIQECDPPGVFARNLAECLALQLRDRDRLDPAMETLIKNLDRLGRRDTTALKRICGVDDEDYAEMVAEIRALDPKPGLSFSAEAAQTVIPDILVRAKRGGGWHLELNADTLPRVLVNQAYFSEVSASARSKSDREYISERMQSANWLIKALHQRATTILKVSTEIARTQDAFLTKGVRHLRPLTLRDVADVIGMHESTVSRVTTNKFMETPRGVFELKYFFTTAIASSVGGDTHSAESVRQRIRDLIDEESPSAVLSDDKIVELLSDANIEIARRTVVKYRKALSIPSSIQRRREKSMCL